MLNRKDYLRVLVILSSLPSAYYTVPCERTIVCSMCATFNLASKQFLCIHHFFIGYAAHVYNHITPCA